jgi:pimeloyl-ACP methyl ester carboxylesterase
MTEEIATVGEVNLCYETFGEPSRPAMLLVMGLGTQMIAWHDDFCARLAGRGFFVIRFDNRDVGRSTKLDDRRPPTLRQLALRDRRGAAYSLADMADDAVGLLDHLDVERAHVVGASMGGMIAQTIAIRHPERVLSLVSIMSNTGARWSGQPAVQLYPVLLGRAPAGRDAYVQRTVKVFKAIGSPGFPTDEDELRRMAERAYDRGVSAAGAGRQLGAIVAERDRSPLLRRLDVPAAVIHGTADRLVRPSGGRSTARAIPGAELVTVEGMGHDLPRGAWTQVLDAIERTAARAERHDAAAAA